MKLLLGNARQGEIVYIDKIDFYLVKDFKWLILRQIRDGYTNKYVYAKIYDPNNWRNSKVIYLHRLLMKPGDGLVVDHLDGDGLNNCRSNLRVCTKSENSKNKRHGRTNSISYRS